MQERNITEIRKAIYDEFNQYDGMKFSFSQLQFGTTDEHIFDVIGESLAEKKVKTARLWEIEVTEDDEFSLAEYNVVYGGSVKEHEVFAIEKGGMSEEDYNEEYQIAIEDLADKARDYNRNMDKQDDCGFYRRAYVIFDKKEDGIPVIKWIVMEHLYFEESVYTSHQMIDVKNINDLETISDYRNDQMSDIYNMACLRWQTYDIPEHLTMVYVKADVTYTPYNENEKVLHIDKIYDGYEMFSKEIDNFYKELKKSDLKKRWKHIAGMDIDKMNELAELFLFENYLMCGLKEMNSAVLRLEGKGEHENILEFLIRQESLDDYIKYLSILLTGFKPEVIRETYAYLKENEHKSPKEVLSSCIEPHLQAGYVPGRVYVAEVYKEHTQINNLGDYSIVKLLDDDSYDELRKRIIKKSDFGYMVWREEDYKATKDDLEKAYLTDNIYQENGKTYIHGWVGEFLPVRITGRGEDGTPIAEFATEWRWAD